MLICLKIKSTYTSEGRDTFTLKEKGFLVNLPSRVDYLGGNLVESYFCYTHVEKYKLLPEIVRFAGKRLRFL